MHTEASRLWSVDMSGRAELLREQAGDFVNVDVSPDGRHVAVEVDGANTQIWTYDLERQTMSRLTFEWKVLRKLGTAAGSLMRCSSVLPVLNDTGEEDGGKETSH